MKYLSLCQTALLVLALATISQAAVARDHDRDSARSQRAQRDCPKCQHQKKKKYDSREVVRTTKTNDHTATVETKSVIPSKRVVETNHLIVHENETRDVGTVQHNRTVVEKEIVLTKRNVDHKYINKVINEVKHEYHTIRRHVIEEREIPGRVRYLGRDPIRAHGKATRGARHASRRARY
jgi:hypothetical protein